MYTFILFTLSLYFSAISINAMDNLDRVPSNQKDLRAELLRTTSPNNKHNNTKKSKSNEKRKTQSRTQERKNKQIINDLNY